MREGGQGERGGERGQGVREGGQGEKGGERGREEGGREGEERKSAEGGNGYDGMVLKCAVHVKE